MTSTADKFDVDVFFTGIFAIVLNEAATKAMLVLPYADGDSADLKKKEAIDCKQLVRHRWLLDFKPEQLADPPKNLPAETTAVWTLSKLKFCRLTLHPTGGVNPFHVGEGLDHIPDLTQIAPKFSTVDSKFLTWNPGAKKIAGQILLDKGCFIKQEPIVTWVFPPTLHEGEWNSGGVEVAHRIQLHFKDVTAFEVQAKTCATAKPECLKLVGNAGKTVKITIGHLADHNPLRWEDNSPAIVDNDFRWYYELVPQQRNDIQVRLGPGLDLPVPHPKPGQFLGQGQNCLLAKTKSQAIDENK